MCRVHRGALVMLTTEDKKWLQKQYPKLVAGSEEVSGIIEFTATYNEKNNRFLILNKDVTDTVGGCSLTGSFKIQIRERTNKSFSDLPALIVEDVETIPDRHFNQSDKTACLCSPLDEGEFLEPSFQFITFFEKLVIPFLYGQLFYSKEGRWPWITYAHGVTGLLESYSVNGDDSAKAKVCIQKLSMDRNWPRIRSLLAQKSYIKGHIPCFCEKEDQIRRCHPKALSGIRQLRIDIGSLRITIPD